ncbi:tRNA-binding protein [Candidatus Micrarchaeota archaeon]|nr:tRNA-binding protein [Candidatus Micrarchaeota archaeon]
MSTITWGDFEKVELRIGRVVKVEDFPEAKKPAYKLEIDFGPAIGLKKSSAQLTKLYSKEQLLGRLVLCVINFPIKQIANFHSECLTTGFVTEKGVVLAMPEQDVPLGSKLA